jgi:two-component system sensor histidine kinase/response regulator
VIRRQLEILGYGVDIADNGMQAFEYWQSVSYALLLTDLHMPRMDGYGLTLAIRQAEHERNLAHLPIIALTANAMKGEEEKCLKSGMDAYLSKPIELASLKATLDDWLSAIDPVLAGVTETAPEAAVDKETAILPVFDPKILTEMMGDNPALHQRLLKKFLTNTEERMAVLQTTIDSGDAARAGDVAHELKSAARSVGAMDMGELCERIEEAGKAGDPAFKLLLPKLQESFEKARQTIRDHLNK